MKVLIVANNKQGFSPFVIEQTAALKKMGVEISFFGVQGKGCFGYLTSLPYLNAKIKDFIPDIIHAHYGLSGLLANFQRKIPVVTTYHGSDIHSKGLILFFSKICMRLSAYNIFVSEYIFKIANYKRKNAIIQACGIDLNTIKPMEMLEARKCCCMEENALYVLFSGRYDNPIKNSELAMKAVKEANSHIKLIELKGYSREEVRIIMNACNCLLLSSYREASPTVIKEAMACNRPIVSTDVGDVKYVFGETNGCFITSYSVDDCAKLINKAIDFSLKKGITNGRNQIISLGLDSENVARKIIGIYKIVLEK
jgi:teichuronic acid biosynthesis glycosyltransferase TuaC